MSRYGEHRRLLVCAFLVHIALRPSGTAPPPLAMPGRTVSKNWARSRAPARPLPVVPPRAPVVLGARNSVSRGASRISRAAVTLQQSSAVNGAARD
jgi:hypothetical protein